MLSARTLLGRFFNRTIILLYHRVARAERDPQLLCVEPEHFAAHIDAMARWGDVVALNELLGDHPRRRRICITFDDGYVDNVTTAAPIMSSAGVPATVFVVAGAIGARHEFWWDELERVIFDQTAAESKFTIEVAGGREQIDLRSELSRQASYWTLYRRLRPLRANAIEAALDGLSATLRVKSEPRESHRGVNETELRLLADERDIAIGAHSMTHPMLSGLSRDEQRAEIAGSRDRLERILGRSVDVFSYPYGGSDAVDDQTVSVVEEAGYSLACSNAAGHISRRADPLRLPRYLVRNWTAADFERHLRQWFAH